MRGNIKTAKVVELFSEPKWEEITICKIFPALHIPSCGRLVGLTQTGNLSYWSMRGAASLRKSQSLKIIWPFGWKNRGPLWHIIPHLSPLTFVFSPFLLSLCEAAQQAAANQTDRDNGGNGRQRGTSEAGLFSNKRGDQTCSLSVKENIILGTGWCRRMRVCFVPIGSSNVIAQIWFQGLLLEIENKCAAFDAPPHEDLS